MRKLPGEEKLFITLTLFIFSIYTRLLVFILGYQDSWIDLWSIYYIHVYVVCMVNPLDAEKNVVICYRFCGINTVLITMSYGDKRELEWMAMSPYGANHIQRVKARLGQSVVEANLLLLIKES